MIYITTEKADINGVLGISENTDSDLRTAPSRIYRRATLDGGAEIINMGTSGGDRTFDIRAFLKLPQIEKLSYIQESSSMIALATEEGVFSGAISDVRTFKGVTKITILSKEKLT